MPTAWAFLAYTGTALLAVVLVGTLGRGHYRTWYSFTCFVLAVLVTSVLMLFWPARFYEQDFWRAKETLHDFLRFAMALELAIRTFRSFPAALSTLRWVTLMVLAATLVAVVSVAGTAVDDTAFLTQLRPRVMNGSIWLFTAIAALILWYRLPIRPFHKAILLSYVPYLLVFTVAMNALGAVGWERGWPVRYANQVAYAVMLVYWSYAAWMVAEAPARSPRLPAPIQEPVSA